MIGSRYVYRMFRALGIKVERYRDPLDELKALAGNEVARVIDGGAFKGTVSQDFLKMFPKAEVHAFEPQSDLYANLASISGGESRWQVHNLALSDSEGEAEFHIPAAAFTASLLTPDAAFGSARVDKVQTTTLDKWSEQHGATDVLKLDLQGAELQALRGATSMLNNVSVILCEVNFVPRYEGCSLFHEIAAFLAEQGFMLHRLYDLRSLPSGAWEMADAIFVKR